MIEGLVSQFDAMTLGEELYTFCFTAFMVGGAVCCSALCLKPEPFEDTAIAPRSEDDRPKSETRPVKVVRHRKTAARAKPQSPRPRRPLASGPTTRPLPHVYRRPSALGSWQASAHAPLQ